MKRDGSWPMHVEGSDPFIDAFAPLDEARTPNSNSRVTSADLPGPEEMARIAADYAPGVGNEAPDRMLGPWADEVDARQPSGRRLRLYALANACFVPPDDDPRTPFTQWCRRTPAPSAWDRARFRAVEASTWDVWPVRAQGESSVALGEARFGGGAVPAVPRDQLAGVREGDPTWVAARSVRTVDGVVALFPIALSAPPSEALVRIWQDPNARRVRGYRFVRMLLEAEFLRR